MGGQRRRDRAEEGRGAGETNRLPRLQPVAGGRFEQGQIAGVPVLVGGVVQEHRPKKIQVVGVSEQTRGKVRRAVILPGEDADRIPLAADKGLAGHSVEEFGVEHQNHPVGVVLGHHQPQKAGTVDIIDPVGLIAGESVGLHFAGGDRVVVEPDQPREERAVMDAVPVGSFDLVAVGGKQPRGKRVGGD